MELLHIWSVESLLRRPVGEVISCSIIARRIAWEENGLS